MASVREYMQETVEFGLLGSVWNNLTVFSSAQPPDLRAIVAAAGLRRLATPRGRRRAGPARQRCYHSSCSYLLEFLVLLQAWRLEGVPPAEVHVRF